MIGNYHNKQWGVEDFQRYHSGLMPAAERHALEKAAMDDPFLDDALEGYAFSERPIAQLNELKRLLQPAEDKKTAAIVWFQQKRIARVLRVAAALIFFVGIAWLLYPNEGDKPVKIAANTAPAATPAVVQPGIIVADSAALSLVETTSNVQQLTTIPPANSLPPARENAGQTRLIVKDKSGATKEKSESTADMVSAAEPVTTTAAFSKRETDANALARQKSDVVLPGVANVISGKVVDDKDKPVPFANLTVPGVNKSIATDASGKFALTNNTNEQVVNVDISAVGFETTSIALAAGRSENKIVLQQSGNPLSEVVVVGYGTSKKSAARSATVPEKLKSAPVSDYRMILKNGRPLESWEEFNKSIGKQMKTNRFIDTTGVVILSFDIDKTGVAQNISVVKKLCDSCDEQAKRILQNAPAMKQVQAGKKVEAVIRFD